MNKTLIIALLSICIVYADSYKELPWESLKGKTEAYDDVFKRLNHDQNYYYFAYERVRVLQEISPESVTENMKKKLVDIKRMFAQVNVDVEKLYQVKESILALRKKDEETLNPMLEGQSISISGFMLPQGDKEKSIQTFYIIPPDRGHKHSYGEPVFNQKILVKLPKDKPTDMLYVPITVKGKLHIDKVDSKGYSLIADSFSKYERKQSTERHYEKNLSDTHHH